MGIDSTEQAIRTVEGTIKKYRDSQSEARFQKMNDLITEVSSTSETTPTTCAGYC